MNLLALVGSVVVVYWSARTGATAVDFFKDWRTGWARWNSEKHERIMPKLSFWSDCLKFVELCQNNSGEYPLEDVLTIDLDKVSTGDAERLAGFRKPMVKKARLKCPDRVRRRLEPMWLTYQHSNVFRRITGSCVLHPTQYKHQLDSWLRQY